MFTSRLDAVSFLKFKVGCHELIPNVSGETGKPVITCHFDGVAPHLTCGAVQLTYTLMLSAAPPQTDRHVAVASKCADHNGGGAGGAESYRRLVGVEAVGPTPVDAKPLVQAPRVSNLHCCDPLVSHLHMQQHEPAQPSQTHGLSPVGNTGE